MLGNTPLSELKKLAEELSLQSTCSRATVGCVITTVGGRIAGTGFNKSHYGNYSHVCNTQDHVMINDHCEATLHAEQEAIISSLTNGFDLLGGYAVLTHSPCPTCAKLLMRVGISTLYIRQIYRYEPSVFQWYKEYGMEVLDWNNEKWHL